MTPANRSAAAARGIRCRPSRRAASFNPAVAAAYRPWASRWRSPSERAPAASRARRMPGRSGAASIASRRQLRQTEGRTFAGGAHANRGLVSSGGLPSNSEQRLRHSSRCSRARRATPGHKRSRHHPSRVSRPAVPHFAIQVDSALPASTRGHCHRGCGRRGSRSIQQTHSQPARRRKAPAIPAAVFAGLLDGTRPHVGLRHFSFHLPGFYHAIPPPRMRQH